MSTRVVSWSDRMELTVETPGGETLTLDIPSLLHDAGLLSKITRDGCVPLRINHATGKYVGVTAVPDGYSALSGRTVVASSSARDTAYQRAVATGVKRTRNDVPRPPPVQMEEAPRPSYEPTSPAYSPTSPAYSPTSPQYAAAETSAEGMREEEEDGEECEFVKERTREERDEDGRANAISLDE